MMLPRRSFLSLSLAALLPGLPRAGAQERLTDAQAERLKNLFPRTYPKLAQRVAVLTAAAGDSISTFYQPEGYPRYDSALAWHGRMLSLLGSYFHYHGGVVDLVPHRDLREEQKAAAAAQAAHTEALSAWARNKKGDAPKAPNPLWFDATAPRPSALRVGDMLRHRTGAASQLVEASVLRVFNAARDGSLAPQAQEALTTEIFPEGSTVTPDLVTICYGVNDSVAQHSLASYRYFLEDAVKRCRAAGSDVLLAAPPVIIGEDLRLELGRTRPYAGVMREVAEAAGVPFVDLGDAMVRAPSNLQALTAEGAFDAIAETVRRQFFYGPEVDDRLHPNVEATSRAGEAVGRGLLLAEAAKPALDVGGDFEITGQDAATLRVRVFNNTESTRAVVVSPLTLGGWRPAPGTPDGLTNLKPAKAKWFSFPCVRHSARLGGESVLRGAALVTDDDEQRLVDLKINPLPVSVKWEDARIDRAAGDVLLTPELTNHSGKPVSGTAVVEWMGRLQELPVKLDPKARQPLPLRLALPDDASPNTRFVGVAEVKLKLEDRTISFRKTVEGIRHLGVQQRIPLALAADPGKEPGVTEEAAAGGWLTAYVHTSGLYLVVELPPGGAGERVTGAPFGTVDVQLDGRNAADNGTAGFIDRLTADIPWEDGAMIVKKPRPAVFGTGYAVEYDPKGFASKVITKPDGGRRIEFNISRANLIHHEWSLDGSGQNSLGINVRLNFPQPAGAAPGESRACQLALSGIPGTDARSLTLLEFSGSPSRRWSLRVY